jgi:formamidopyrimidine-DNA glycosylase
MPELPEVETIRSRLARGLTGRRLDSVEIRDPRLTRPEPPELVAAALEGERIADVRRRGKYLVVGFESGRHLLVHLRMTGSVLHPAAGGWESDPHVRAVVRLDDGSDVLYRDVRRFGTWDLLEEREL